MAKVWITGAGISKARGLYEHPIEVGNLARPPIDKQLAQGLLQIGAHRAADAAIGKQTHAFGSGLHQIVIDADLADLIDDDRSAIHPRMPQQPAQQGGLAAAEKSGEDSDGKLAGK